VNVSRLYSYVKVSGHCFHDRFGENYHMTSKHIMADVSTAPRLALHIRVDSFATAGVSDIWWSPSYWFCSLLTHAVAMGVSRNRRYYTAVENVM
jgi:hypothetical protein